MACTIKSEWGYNVFDLKKSWNPIVLPESQNSTEIQKSQHLLYYFWAIKCVHVCVTTFSTSLFRLTSHTLNWRLHVHGNSLASQALLHTITGLIFGCWSCSCSYIDQKITVVRSSALAGAHRKRADPGAKSSVSLQNWCLTLHFLAHWHGQQPL